MRGPVTFEEASRIVSQRRCGEGKAVVVGKAAKARILASANGPSFGPWYVSHFATCPRPRALDKATA